MARALQLADILEVIADAVPDRPFIITNDRTYTYAEIDERATRLANYLAARGVKAGDHIGIHAPNRVEWVDSFFAAFKLRAVPVNVNYKYVEAELRYLYDNADCVAVIVAPEYRAAVADVEDTLPSVHTVLTMGDDYDAALAAASPERPAIERSADDIYVLYTGGTTGMPKGTLWRHEDIIFAALNAQRGGAPIDDLDVLGEQAAASESPLRSLGIGPLMHGGAQWGLGNALLAGGTYVMYCGAFDPHEVLRLAERARVTSIATIGDAMARPVIEAIAEDTSRYDLSAMFMIGNGGAPLSEAVRQQIRQHMPHLMIIDAYGASETGVSGSRADDGTGHSAPRFHVGPEATVLTDDGRQCAVGEIGKYARSGYIPLGYYKDPEKTAATFPVVDGIRWVVPGDFATIEDDGTITILGRGSVSINTGGEKVFPEEVEAALKQHPAVFDAAVVGTPNERWGEQVTALITFRPGMSATAEQIVTHCHTLVANYKAPKSIIVVDQIGRTPSGKVDYTWAKNYALKELGLS